MIIRVGKFSQYISRGAQESLGKKADTYSSKLWQATHSFSISSVHLFHDIVCWGQYAYISSPLYAYTSFKEVERKVSVADCEVSKFSLTFQTEKPLIVTYCLWHSVVDVAWLGILPISERKNTEITGGEGQFFQLFFYYKLISLSSWES